MASPITNTTFYTDDPRTEPDPTDRCTCRCEFEDHNNDGTCNGCGDCDGFEPYDTYQAREDHGFELADIAWKERDR